MSESKSHLIYGPPGSGKTTVSEEVCRDLGIEYLSIGEITRSEITSGSEIGKKLKYYLDIPIEYPVELISELIESKLSGIVQNGKSFLLDGYPKYYSEAERFTQYLDVNNWIQIDTVIVIDVPLETALIRIKNRYICSNCGTNATVFETSNDYFCDNCGGGLIKRDDDNEDFIKIRYNDYEKSIGETLGLLDGQYKKLLRVDGAKTQSEIIEIIKSNIEI